MSKERIAAQVGELGIVEPEHDDRQISRDALRPESVSAAGPIRRIDLAVSRLVHPAYTTMDCAHCDARAKHAMPLGERTYTCTACGNVSPRDKNSARVMLVRAWREARRRVRAAR